ncbi:Uncharacterised protein [Chlamydia trachomatis]|nr:Uncharacterised protein [Chlamydia trachomatis]
MLNKVSLSEDSDTMKSLTALSASSSALKSKAERAKTSDISRKPSGKAVL